MQSTLSKLSPLALAALSLCAGLAQAQPAQSEGVQL